MEARIDRDGRMYAYLDIDRARYVPFCKLLLGINQASVDVSKICDVWTRFSYEPRSTRCNTALHGDQLRCCSHKGHLHGRFSEAEGFWQCHFWIHATSKYAPQMCTALELQGEGGARDCSRYTSFGGTSYSLQARCPANPFPSHPKPAHTPPRTHTL